MCSHIFAKWHRIVYEKHSYQTEMLLRCTRLISIRPELMNAIQLSEQVNTTSIKRQKWREKVQTYSANIGSKQPQFALNTHSCSLRVVGHSSELFGFVFNKKREKWDNIDKNMKITLYIFRNVCVHGKELRKASKMQLPLFPLKIET